MTPRTDVSIGYSGRELVPRSWSCRDRGTREVDLMHEPDCNPVAPAAQILAVA